MYRVPVLKLLDVSPEELTKRKMIYNIAENIEENRTIGSITEDDARKLKRLTHKLYEHIYSHYEEMEELNHMTDESLMLDIDIIEKRHEEEMAEVIRLKDWALREKDAAEKAANALIAEKDQELEELRRKLKALQEKAAEK